LNYEVMKGAENHSENPIDGGAGMNARNFTRNSILPGSLSPREKMDPKAVKKLVFVLPSARGGGAEGVLLRLLAYVNRDLFDLHAIIIDPTGPLLSMVPPGVPLYGLGSHGSALPQCD
jgi:hypothetical protein